jgi:hypothetical protein
MKLLCAILAYVVTIVISLCAVSTGVLGKEYKQIPIPWQYDYPYRGNLTVQYVDPKDTHEVCGFKDSPSLGRNGFVQACAWVRDFDCKIVLPRNNGVYSQQHYAYIIRHEIAHCNGWKH